MKLIELCRYAGIDCPSGLWDVEITSVTCDSRRVKRGSLFVCIKGTRDDGNAHAEEARAAGAAAILSDERRDLDLYSFDAKRALAYLCRKMYGEGIDRLRLVGVTGTNGKTSVTAMLRSVLSSAGRKCASIGTLGCFLPNGQLLQNAAGNMTTPDPEILYPLLSKLAESGAEDVIMEVSSHALAERKVDALRFDTGIFTNFTRDHLDFHKSEENYFEAKKRIFLLSERVLVNADDERLASLEGALTCSARHAADFCAEDVIYYGEQGCGYRFLSEHYRFGLVSRIPGRFTVINTLLAASCAALLDVEPEYIKQGIYSLSVVEGRMEKVALPEAANFSVYIDYAHTPDALLNLLLTAKGFAVGKIILVFGCGGERDRGKRPEMAAIAARFADKIIITADNSRNEDPERIFEDILAGLPAFCDHVLIKERAEAIEYAISIAEGGDTVLLAGKGHEKYEINSNGKIYFNEAEIAKKACEKKLG